MKNIIITLLTIIVSGGLYAAGHINSKTENHINTDIALLHSVKQLTQSRNGTSYIGVGADTQGCHFSTIQAAINAFAQSGVTEIRVARNKTYNENLVIDDMNISIVGGYFDCSSMSLPDAIGGPGNSQSIINGGAVTSVMKIVGATQRNTIALKNLRLINGRGTTLAEKTTGAGLFSFDADAQISLTNLDITNNQAFYGAGISMFNGDTDMILINTRVFSNSAKYAGGVYCQGGGSSLVLTDNSGINGNVTTGIGNSEVYGRGGGAFINKCYFALYSGSDNGGLVGISGNIASGSGGGIYAQDESIIIINGHKNCNAGSCIGDDINPANISNNSAGFSSGGGFGSGGGIYAHNSSVNIFAGLISDNANSDDEIYTGGGGMRILFGDLLVGRLNKECWDAQRCNFFSGNTATNSQRGGAIYCYSSECNISSSYFEDNTAFNGAAVASSGSSNTRIEGSVFNNNGNDSTDSIIYNYGMSDMEIIHSTIADNLSTVTVIKSVSDFSSNVPSLAIHASIFDNQFIPVLTHNTFPYFVNISHVISNEIQSLSNIQTINDAENIAGGSFITFAPTFVGPALFVDRNNRDYHLAENSPAIDYAYTTPRATVMYQDIDFEDRFWDDLSIADNYTFSYFDIGADESYGNDIIFKDGFEN